MGLTVHYTLAHPGPLAPASARSLVHAAHRRASALVRRRDLAEIGPVLDVHAAPFPPDDVVFERRGDATVGYDVPVEIGWVFRVTPGKGCESAWFGLGHYPARLRVGRRWLPTGCGGWNWSDFCKTQYASEHGTEHFLHCHRAVIDLLLVWQRLGCTVKITDEGDYWPGRDEQKLRAAVGRMDRLMAGLAGALKDAADERGGKIEAPIFAHPHFERLEAEAVAAHGDRLQQAGTLLAHLGHLV